MNRLRLLRSKGLIERWFRYGLFFLVAAVIIIDGGFALFIRNTYYDTEREALYGYWGEVREQLSSARIIYNGNELSQITRVMGTVRPPRLIETSLIDVNNGIAITGGVDREMGEAEQRLLDELNMSSDATLFRVRYEGGVHGMELVALQYIGDIGWYAFTFYMPIAAVDGQVMSSIWMVTLVTVVVLLFAIIIAAFFIRGVIGPVAELSAISRRISGGDFDVRIKKQHDDEIGELCDVINDMAEELSRKENVKNDFISSVSHELRTPLTAIKGWSETIMDIGPSEPETYKKGLEIIALESQRLSDMVEELLDFSRIASGRFSLYLQRTDLFAELSEAALMFAQRARVEGKTLRVEERVTLPDIYGDRDRLRQVFINILDNAFKYTERGGVITVSAGQEGGKIWVSIADDGIGIEATDLPKIRELFYKKHKNIKGTGIGLAVVEEIISLHGGELEIDSAVGRGTTVKITFSVKAPAPKADLEQG